VQGVWFRASARDRALELGIDGWARNLADGRVEIEAEGTAAAIEAFLGWCARGPDGARVDAVGVTDQDPMRGPAGFRVRRD
jgi:acylphosphatase